MSVPHWTLILAFTTLAMGCGVGSSRGDLSQCAGNHPGDSLAIWLQRAIAIETVSGVQAVAAHPTKNCISIGIAETADSPAILSRVAALGIPTDAVVIAETGGTQ